MLDSSVFKKIGFCKSLPDLQFFIHFNVKHFYPQYDFGICNCRENTMGGRRRRGLFGRAAADRPKDSKESFFFVKEEKAEQILSRGIACAVEREVRGETKYFLLTSTDVKNEQGGRVFAKRSFCSFQLPWSKWKRKREVEIGNNREHEDFNFSFTPIDYKPEKPFKLIPKEKLRKQNEKCRSFVITRDSFTTVYWEYNSDAQRYQLNGPEGTELEEPNAAGSPVVWTDQEQNQSYVVGVIRRQSPRGIFLPEMFSSGSLQLTGKNLFNHLICSFVLRSPNCCRRFALEQIISRTDSFDCIIEQLKNYYDIFLNNKFKGNLLNSFIALVFRKKTLTRVFSLAPLLFQLCSPLLQKRFTMRSY